VFHSKDKRYSQDNQDKDVVQMKYREQKRRRRIPLGTWFDSMPFSANS
jgi:hypothetical protein